MRFAIKNNIRILSNPFEKDAICPLCGEPVMAKCGKIKVWHWAHVSNKECDLWTGRETQWHLEWKDNFDKSNQEIIIKNIWDEKHIADIKIKDIVIELQNSSISFDNIREREKFYKMMKWVINGETIGKNIMLRSRGKYYTFRWKWPAKSWAAANCPIYIDLGISELGDGEPYHKLFLIKKINWGGYVGGWGKIISKENFIMECKDGYYRN